MSRETEQPLAVGDWVRTDYSDYEGSCDVRGQITAVMPSSWAGNHKIRVFDGLDNLDAYLWRDSTRIARIAPPPDEEIALRRLAGTW